MISLVGLGNTGIKIVEKLSVHNQYKVVTIDSGQEIKEYNSPEEYEAKCPSFKKKI
jgi:6-phosphogluconate dehydrogenase (decarboxylating)